jgi:hypothetical protein
MDEAVPPRLGDRLRLVEALLRAVEESLSPMQRLLAQIHREVDQALDAGTADGPDTELTALRREVEQLREGLATRGVIERAKGMLMSRHEISEGQAFELLSHMSQRSRRKLRDVAAEVAGATPAPRLSVVAPRAPAQEPVS